MVKKLSFTEADHDMLQDVRTALYGHDGHDGIIKNVDRINLVLSGNPLAVSYEDKQGLVGTVREHLREEKIHREAEGRRRNRMWAIIVLLVTASSSFVSYILDFIFHANR